MALGRAVRPLVVIVAPCQAAENPAEGERQATVFRAQGDADVRRRVEEPLGEQNVTSVQHQVALVCKKPLATLSSEKPGDKTVLLPTESSSVLGGRGSLKELLLEHGSGAAVTS